MNLKEYLFYSEMTVKEFAEKADVDKCYLSSVITQNRKPSPRFLRSIARASNNKVTAETIFMPTKLPEGWEEEGGKAA